VSTKLHGITSPKAKNVMLTTLRTSTCNYRQCAVLSCLSCISYFCRT
jgi:hypothetical protein